jgi:predicted secreted protein
MIEMSLSERINAEIRDLHATADPYSAARTPMGQLAVIRATLRQKDEEIVSANRQCEDARQTIEHLRQQLARRG